MEALLDAFESRADLVALAIDPTHGLRDYEPVVLQADAAVVLGMSPDRTSGRDDERTATLPGRDGPVALADDRLAWFSQIGDLRHSEAGSTSDRTRSIGEGFYRGGTVSWFELGLGADVPRRETAEILARVKADLTERAPLRIPCSTTPGRGTTIARHIAWDLHLDYPVLVADRVTDHGTLATRVREAHRLTNMSVLVVVESTTDAVIDRTYSALRAESVPCVFLIVERRADKPTRREGDRSFDVSGLEPGQDRRAFVEAFGGRCHTSTLHSRAWPAPRRR